MKMSDYQSSHYDIDHEARGKTMLVLDVFKNMAEAIDNDVIPSSREDPIIAGIESPASTLSSTGNRYTSLMLKPMTKDVNFLFENHVHHLLELNIEATCDNAPEVDQEFAIYFDNAWTIPSKGQVLVGNSGVWNNQFGRIEAMANMASVPQEVLQTSDGYTTMSKLVNREPIPGGYITWKKSQTSQNFTFIVDATGDLNHMTPVISNVPIVTNQMGEWTLRLFYDDLEQALSITPLPSRGYNGTGLSLSNFHVLEKLPLEKPFKFKTDTIQPLATGANTIGASTNGKKSTFKFKLASWRAIGTGVEITQCNFSVKEDSVDAMKKYMSEDNKLVIPSQTWSTSTSTAIPNGSSTNELVFQISAYNIYLLAFLFPYNSLYNTYFPHPRFQNINIKLNSKMINYLPYRYVDSRLIKDTIQAFLNDDKYGPNENLVNSLNLAPYTGVPYDKNAYASVYSDTGGPLIYRPNAFCIAKGLSPPNSFEKGYCVASSNPKGTQVLFSYSITENIDEGIDQLNPGPFTNTNSVAYCLALQDCCIVLNYNPNIGSCQSGSIVYAEPISV